MSTERELLFIKAPRDVNVDSNINLFERVWSLTISDRNKYKLLLQLVSYDLEIFVIAQFWSEIDSFTTSEWFNIKTI